VGESEYPGGITSSPLENMYGGDGFWMFVDPTDRTTSTPSIKAVRSRVSTQDT